MTSERLVIVVDASSKRSMQGKTAALASIVREIHNLVGPGARLTYVGTPSDELLTRIRDGREPDFDRNDIDLHVEVFHREAVHA